MVASTEVAEAGNSGGVCAAGARRDGELLKVLQAERQRVSKDGGSLMREGEASAVGWRWRNSCMEKRERRSAVVLRVPCMCAMPTW